MAIEIVEVNSKKLSKVFIGLPWEIYKNDSNWVPQLKMALNDMFSPKHPFYEEGVVKRWLALKDGKFVGRIAAILNPVHNRFHEEKTGFFGFFESINDQDVADALFLTARKYLLDNGMESVQGPINLSTNYECGLLVEGYNDDPQIMMTYNPEYYAGLIEKAGFAKAKDLIAYQYDTNQVLPEKIVRISDRLSSKENVSWRTVDKSKWDQEVQTMYEIYNDAWEKNWGFVPMSKAEFQHSAKDLKQVVNTDFVLFAEVDGEPVGFVVALPDLNQVLKKIPNGRLLPTGIFKLLRAKKYINRMRVITLGLKKEYQVKGLSTILYQQLFKQIQKYPEMTESEFSWILEDNTMMRRPLELAGAEHYKTYRIYEMPLS